MSSNQGPELSVVIPTHNEAEVVGDVLRDWVRQLDDLGIDHEFTVYDDGSSDGTLEELRAFADHHERVRVVSHPNRGHGPTCHRGYREASGSWVFQTDSDGEMTPSDFPAVWAARDGADFVIGYRTGRSSGLGRRILSAGARCAVALLFGGLFRDVNAPFRLMRTSWLRRVLPAIPEETFAPNVALVGLAARTSARVREIPVRAVPREAGTSSLSGSRVARAALRSFREIMGIALGSSRAGE